MEIFKLLGIFKSCVSALFYLYKIFQTNYSNLIAWSVRALGHVKGKGRNISGVTDVICILIGMLVTQIHTFVQTHGTIHLRPGHFSVHMNSILIAVTAMCRRIKKLKQVLKGYT